MKRQRLMYSFFWILIFSFCVNSFPASLTAASGTFQDDKESLHGILLKTQLDPPLRDDIQNLRFSPNGKYILAQDDAGITVLTRSPFATVFRFDARSVSDANFTPDSQNIVFNDSNLRVSNWSLAEQKLASVHDVMTNGNCNHTLLSPDGKTLACLEFGSNVVLIDVATDNQILRQDDFYVLPFEGMLILFPEEVFRDKRLDRQVHMNFSPDGHYFAAGVRHLRQRELIYKSRVVADASKIQNPKGFGDNPNEISPGQPNISVYEPDDNAESSRAFAFDITKRKQLSLGGPLKDLLAGGFTFLSPDRVAGIHRKDRAKSALVSFPSGETIKTLPLEQGQMDAPGRGNYVLIRPLKNYPVGVMSLTDGSLLMANKKAAFDIYEDVYVAERADGEIGLYGIGKNDLRATVQLPRGALTYIGAIDVSPDFNFLGVSGKSRAAVWDLKKGERVFNLRSFEGAYFASDGAFYVDFPKLGSVGRTIAILQTRQREVVEGQPIPDQEGARSEQFGQYLTINRRYDPDNDTNKNASLEVKDVQSMKQLWVKTFAKRRPRLWVDATNDTMVLGWNATEDVVKEEIKRDSKLSAQLRAIKEKGLVYLFQVLNAGTGQQRGSILFDTQESRLYVTYVLATNDSVVAITSRNGILVYSLVSGEKRAQLDGSYASVSRGSNLMCVRNTNKQLTIYDLATLKERDQFTFSSPVAIARFSNDGKRLFVLTESQTAYVLDISSSSSP
jgi:WD40 repeat protein